MNIMEFFFIKCTFPVTIGCCKIATIIYQCIYVVDIMDIE